jgi:hypothetical protein
MRKIFLALGAVLISIVSWAQADARPQILVLATYHMANPGHDIYNLEADDVLAPKRQQEIARLIEVLKEFHPTKIAVESDVWSKKVGQQYSDYLAGNYTLSRNEIDQIGYRLAKELSHQAVYPVNEDGDFPIARVTNWAKANGRAQKLDAISTGWGSLVKEEDQVLRSHTVLETLEYLNSDARATKDMAMYFATVPYGEPGDEAGADLLAAWYQRNIRIYQNIVKLIESPSDRILVIYGSGHLGWLRQNVANDQTVSLRKLGEFTRKE